MPKVADRVASLRNDPALLLENAFAGGNGKVLSRTKDAFGKKCKERRIKPGNLMLVGNDQGERWGMVMKITGYVVDVVNGRQVVRDELVCEGYNCWSVAHLLKAIAEGKVLNADLFAPQIAGLDREVNFLAYNHTSVVHAEQVITGITEGEMDRVAAVHPTFFLQIGDGKVTDWEDPYKAHEFLLVSREDLPHTPIALNDAGISIACVAVRQGATIRKRPRSVISAGSGQLISAKTGNIINTQMEQLVVALRFHPGMAYYTSPSPSLEGLPAELISEVAIIGQRIWLRDKCQKQTATAGTMRDLPLELNQDDCRGVTAGVVKECLADITALSPEPARALMDTNSKFRNILRSDKTVWREANTLMRSNALLAGERLLPPPELAAAGARFSYAGDIFVGENICSCPISRYIQPFFPTLRVVVISVPWADFMEPSKTSVAHFFCGNHSQQASPLEFFALHLHEDIYVDPDYLLAYRSPSIETCRIYNAAIFFHGPLLRELDIAFPFGNRHFFGPSFLNALNQCPALQSLTFMGGCCEMIEVALGSAFDDDIPATVRLPSLRYLRLLLPVEVGSRLLGLMALPVSADVHLEPVLSWRAAASVYAAAGPAAFSSSAGAQSSTGGLWQYAAVLAAPARAPTLSETPPNFLTPVCGLEREILHSLTTVAMDVQFESPLRQSYQFPDQIRFVLGANIESVLREIDGGAHNSCAPAAMKATKPLRSIALRSPPGEVERGVVSTGGWPEQFGYAAILHVAEVLMEGRGQTQYAGLRPASSFVLPPKSWRPTTSAGWHCALKAFASITELTIQSAGVDCLEGLALYLKGQNDKTPLARLRTIHMTVQPLSPEAPGGDFLRGLDSKTNTAARLASGAAVIRWEVVYLNDEQ